MVEIGGAKSSELKPNYHQIPARWLRKVAQRFSLGSDCFDAPEAKKLGGKMNWQGGDAEFLAQRFNHALEHLLAWKEDYDLGQPHSDGHLEAVAWFTAIADEAERTGLINPERQPIPPPPAPPPEPHPMSNVSGFLFKKLRGGIEMAGMALGMMLWM